MDHINWSGTDRPEKRGYGGADEARSVREQTVLEAINAAVDRANREVTRLMNLRENTPHNVLSMRASELNQLSSLINRVS